MTTHKPLAWMLVAWLGLRAAGSLSAQQPVEEFSCTSFPADLGEVDLIKQYGNANVKRAPVTGSDDGPQDGTVVFDDTPRKLEIVWWDPQTRSRLAWVRSHEPNSPWQTPNGISIGMDLLDIERRNGSPFRLRGLRGPEGLGVIRSWGQGRLRDAGDDGCRLRISLQSSGDRPIDPALYRQVSRRSDFSSGHPAMQTINPRVASLWVTHDPVRK